VPGGWELVATVGLVLIGGIVFGLAGFGFALFSAPPLLFLYAPVTIVVMVNVLSSISGIVVVRAERRDVDFQIIRVLIPPATVGLIAGVFVLRYVDGSYIKVAAGIVVFAFALLIATGFRVPGARHRRAPVAAVFCRGLLGTTSGLNGPPVALLFTARGLPPTVFRVTITTYFMAVDILVIVLLAATGQLRRDDLVLALAMIPASLVGRWIGRRLAGRLTPETFRRIVIGLLLVTGASGAIGAGLSLR
jgi:uncharacterized membrane protein YfcA